MAKNVLVLSGSPRKGGNSDMLCDRFAAGAEEAGHRVEKISLREKNIRFCTGCEACRKDGVCIQHDDMAEVLEKMVAAEVIVMASPVYFYSMNGQIKTLIDRTFPRYTELRDKAFYFLLTAADGEKRSLDRAVEGFRAFLSCLDGAREKGVVYGAGAWKKGDIKNGPAMAEAYDMGKNA